MVGINHCAKLSVIFICEVLFYFTALPYTYNRLNLQLVNPPVAQKELKTRRNLERRKLSDICILMVP